MILKLFLLVISLCVWAISVDAKSVQHKRELDCKTLTSSECSDAVLAGLGHGPTFKLKGSADVIGDVVNGAVSIAFCEPVIFGETVIGKRLTAGGLLIEEFAAPDNVVAYLARQGHQVIRALPNGVSCDTIITVDIYEQDNPPKAKNPKDGKRKSYLKRPAVMPSDAEIKARLDAVTIP